MSRRPACIVPLAGPDLIHPTLGPKPLFEVEGRPLVEAALSSRRWAAAIAPEDHWFVLRETPGVEPVIDLLRTTFPGCGVVRLPRLTGGALYSALAGVAALPLSTGPIIVDLVDILFEGGPGAEDLVVWPDGLGGLVPWFLSDDPGYSYLRCDGDRVLETAEKRVISDRASAGVYLFRDAATFTAAAAHSMANAASLAHAGALFVCPMMNGVIAAGDDVRAIEVGQVRSVSAYFRSTLTA